MRSHLLAGAFAGAAGLVVFLVIHHSWIMPIWFILPVGLVVAVLGGLAVGWSFAELHPNLPNRPWSILSWVALSALTLLPAIILAEMRAPMFDIRVTGSVLMISVGQAAFLFILELVVPAAVAGGLAGWFIGRTRSAMISTAFAGFVFALGPGHNIPFLGSTPGTLKGLLILIAIVFASAVVLVELQAKLDLSSRFKIGNKNPNMAVQKPQANGLPLDRS